MTGIHTFGAVRYQNLYPGVDARFYGDQGRLEYDLIVAPGADPARIGLALGGAERLRLDGRGGLRVRMPGGTLLQQRPRVYQTIDGRRQAVSGGYVLRGGDRFGLPPRRLRHTDGRWSSTRPRLLDLPGRKQYRQRRVNRRRYRRRRVRGGAHVFRRLPDDARRTRNLLQRAAWMRVRGQARAERREPRSTRPTWAEAGSTRAWRSPSIPWRRLRDRADPLLGLPDDARRTRNLLNGGVDAFVAKLSPSGSSLVYSTYLGGSGREDGTGSRSMPPGARTSTGYTASAGFPTTPGASTPPSTAAWSVRHARSLRAARASPTRPTSAEAIPTELRDRHRRQRKRLRDGRSRVRGLPDHARRLRFFLRRRPRRRVRDQARSERREPLAYSTYLGGGDLDSGSGIAVDAAESAYVTGVTYSADFPTTAGAFDTSFGGATDGFVTKFAPSGASLAYSAYLGGSDGEGEDGIAVDAAGSAYVTGDTSSADFPTTPGAPDTSYNGARGRVRRPRSRRAARASSTRPTSAEAAPTAAWRSPSMPPGAPT